MAPFRINTPLVAILVAVCVIFFVSFYVVEVYHAKYGHISYRRPPIPTFPTTTTSPNPTKKEVEGEGLNLGSVINPLPVVDSQRNRQHSEVIAASIPEPNRKAGKPNRKPKMKPDKASRDHVEAPLVLEIPSKKYKKGNPYWTPKIYNHLPDWGSQHELQYIDMMPTPKKIMLKKDRKVVFPDITIPFPSRDVSLQGRDETPADLPPRAAQQATSLLQQHLVHRTPAYSSGQHNLEDVLYVLQRSTECIGTPLFLTLATIGDELYVQLVENFVYTLAKFNLASCALVICVSDPNCMQLCKDKSFPCFAFAPAPGDPFFSSASPSVMEQIALLKLKILPKALLRGVDVFLLDLDVGFISTPAHILTAFRETPLVDVFVQEDYTFIMNRTQAGWKSWFTEPLPNIGAMLVRGNNKTHRVFDIAYNKYVNMEDSSSKMNPGKDQNHVLEAMRIGRGTFGLKYAYLSPSTAPLLDKLILFNGPQYELGGELTQQLLHDKQAMLLHTTCYEKSTKVMGLKLGAAYWNPVYYDARRRTITKQLLYISDQQVLDEVRSLLYLGSLTGRAVIIPNLLGGDESVVDRSRAYRVVYKGQKMWPGFRVLYIKMPGERYRERIMQSSKEGVRCASVY
ncbi:hypothetical protein EON64_00930 [archaeon]|nr:MAG: hypothetical protein EON64_00930 [archaeon]